ncbi:MAG: AMP-binding protein [Rikenellaceae bacterium]
MELIEYTFGELAEKWAEETPNHEFLISPYKGIRYTYSQFNERVDNLAAAFTSIGVKKGCKVGLWANNHPDWITIFFATAKVGAILVTVNTNYKSSEAEYILQNANIHTMCMIESYRDTSYVDAIYTIAPKVKERRAGEAIHSVNLPDLRNLVVIGAEVEYNEAGDCVNHPGMIALEALVAKGAEMDKQPLREIAKGLSPQDVVNMQYTSGTTGFPKGVLLTHYNILNNGKATGEAMKYTADDKLLVCVPMFHCFGCVLALCAVITHGATMVMLEDFDALKVLESIHKERCTILYGVPTMFIAELNHPEFDTFDLTSLRTGIMAGAVCPIDTMNAVMDRMHCRVISVYGLTESSPGMTVSNIDDSTKVRATTVGRPFPGIDVQIISHESGEVLPAGKQGEVCCRGWNVMKGYYNNPGATAEVIDSDGYLHSGDLGMVDEDGYFHITGRIKEMIIRGGENIYPREIENFLYNMPGIKGIEVVGLPSPRYGEQVAAFITLKDGVEMNAGDVAAFCDGKIARYKCPKYIFFIDAYPMTASGKIQKYRLRELGVSLLEQRNEVII